MEHVLLKPKHLFFALFATCLAMSGAAYGNGHGWLSLLFLLMALASALNASHPSANRRAGLKDLAALLTPRQ